MIQAFPGGLGSWRDRSGPADELAKNNSVEQRGAQEHSHRLLDADRLFATR